MTVGCSVVLCTSGGRLAWLQRCLKSLQEQNESKLEVICVSLVEIPSVTAERAVTFITEERSGLALARNVGLRRARFPIIAFTDDDCVADSHWVGRISAAFEEERVACVTGRVLPIREGSWHVAMPSSTVTRDYRGVADLRWPFDPGSGNNMAFRREVLERLGGFDERLGLGSTFRSAEDLDAFIRVLEAGHWIRYLPDAIVSHEPLDNDANILRSLSGYRYGLGALFAKFQDQLDCGAPEFVMERDGRGLARAFLDGDFSGIRLRWRAISSLVQGFRAWKALMHGG